MRENERIRGFTCRNCGAPVTMEICPYCGQKTGITSEQANMEYSSIECKEVTVQIMTASASILMFMVCMLFGFCISYATEGAFKYVGYIFLFGAAISFIIFFKEIVIKNIMKLAIKLFGKRIEATVYGYVKDENGAQAVKLLCDTSEGYIFAIYQLGVAEQEYEINSEVGLRVIGQTFLIDKPKTIDWNETNKNGK